MSQDIAQQLVGRKASQVLTPGRLRAELGYAFPDLNDEIQKAPTERIERLWDKLTDSVVITAASYSPKRGTFQVCFGRPLGITRHLRTWDLRVSDR